MLAHNTVHVYYNKVHHGCIQKLQNPKYLMHCQHKISIKEFYLKVDILLTVKIFKLKTKIVLGRTKYIFPEEGTTCIVKNRCLGCFV